MVRKTKTSKEDLLEKKKKFEQIAGNLEELPVDKFLKDNFLPYSWSFNLDRALVDTTGLKPVQRRILYTMYKSGLTPSSGRAKVATLAGKVLAYHPHGNTSVEDALKNLGREHIFRVPLVDGKGDFGAPGTPGAAGRYIEARLNKAAWLLVEDLSENAVRFVPNYDGQETEPVKIPVKWPVSLVNGGSGIAIAYASSMPSHNPTEIMKALKAVLKNPDVTAKALSKIILGPDFNMGGFIPSRDGVVEYLETGSGSFKIRGNYTVEDKPRGAVRIEFFEIPFGTSPEKIITEIQKNVSDKNRFKEISSFKDLSDLKNPIRIIVDTKPGSNYKKVVQDLFSFTSLESSFAANMTTIVDNKPKQSSMKELLSDFIEFRKECVINKLSYSLDKKNKRLHLIEGLLKTLLDIDAAIVIIRKSDDSDSANVALQRKFKIDKDQADYVLSLQLKRLTKMDSVALSDEKKKLEDEVSYFSQVLTDNDVLVDYLSKEFDETAKIIGDDRKTQISDKTDEELIEETKIHAKALKDSDKPSACVVTLFSNGSLIRSPEAFSYSDRNKIKFSPIVQQISVMTNDDFVVVLSDGTARKIPVSYLPNDGVTTAVKAGIDITGEVRVVGVAPGNGKGYGLAIGTTQGVVKVSKPDWGKKEEFSVINLDNDDSVVCARWLTVEPKESFFYFVTSNSNILLSPLKAVRFSGSAAGGVAGVKLTSSDDRGVSFGVVDRVNDMIVLSRTKEFVKATSLSEVSPKGRGSQGVILQAVSGTESVVEAYVGREPVAVLPDLGVSINLPPTTPRARKGTKIPGALVFGAYSALL